MKSFQLIIKTEINCTAFGAAAIAKNLPDKILLLINLHI